MTEQREVRKKYILFGIAILFFTVMAVWKLTAAPLWLDETLEYYISRTMTGPLEWYGNNGVYNTTNMYQRMMGGLQPPLYNFLMYFWLLINDGEIWYRMASVIASVIGAVGIYKAVDKISNYKIATVAVFLYSCVYEVMYYAQECGEYAMQLMFIAWLVYIYILIMEKITLKRIILFSVFCVLNMYTQYGAVFVIVPLAISILLHVLREKKFKELKQLVMVYAVMVIGAALPLLIYFVIPQLQNQSSSLENPEAWNFYNNSVIQDMIHMFIDVFRWNTIESMTRFFVPAVLATIILLVVGIFCLIKGKSVILKHLLICNVFTWFLYYIPTRAGIYARGYFGFRYNLFFIPLWLITIVWSLYETYQCLDGITDEKKRVMIRNLYRGILCITAVGYCIYGAHQINKRWEKSDVRGCVAAWYQETGYDKITLVDPLQTPSFSYYFEHDKAYEESYEASVFRLKEKPPTSSQNEESDAEIKAYYENSLEELFQGEWPDEFYYFVGNWDASPLKEIFLERGYTADEVYCTTAQLYYVHK